MSLIKDKGLISLTPTADHSSSEGYAVKFSDGNAALVTAAADASIGIITDGEDTAGKDSVALFGSGLVVHVKLSGTVAQGAELQQAADGSFITDAAVGARKICARALEAGVSGDLIQALLLPYDARV